MKDWIFEEGQKKIGKDKRVGKCQFMNEELALTRLPTYSPTKANAYIYSNAFKVYSSGRLEHATHR